MKNTINSIRYKKAKFTNKFCEKRFDVSKKCHKFYLLNFEKGKSGMVKCPYGYACYFFKNIVLSSIVNEKYSDLKTIYFRSRHLKKSVNRNLDFKILTDSELDKLIRDTEQQYELDIYRDTFHDLNNNNRSLKDLIEKIEPLLNERILDELKELFNIFELHNFNLSSVTSFGDKLKIYKNEIEEIDKIKTSLLKEKAMRDKKIYDLRSNLEFIDFRIRYLQRLVDADYHREKYRMDLNILSIITKLKYAFVSTLNKKQQRIEVHLNNNIKENYNINCFDDIYLGYFILLENAIKYSPLGSTIDVYIDIKDEKKIIVKIMNNSEHISNTKNLTRRGHQGENYKDGSGIGLSIADDIFVASNLLLTTDYDEGIFTCIISPL